MEITEDGLPRTVEMPAAPNGTAVFPVRLTEEAHLRVSSRSANGWISDQRWWSGGNAIATEVTSDVYPENRCGGGGVPGRFTFPPHALGLVGFIVRRRGCGCGVIRWMRYRSSMPATADPLVKARS